MLHLTETPGNLYINVVEARDLTLPSGWMSKNVQAAKSNRNSQLINIVESAVDNVWQTDMKFDKAMILSAVLKGRASCRRASCKIRRAEQQ